MADSGQPDRHVSSGRESGIRTAEDKGVVSCRVICLRRRPASRSERMAVRCPGCGRLSRDETMCEWCRTEIPPAARRFTAAAAAGAGTAAGEPSTRVPDPEAVDAVSRQEAAEIAAEVRREAEAAAEEPLKPVDGETVAAEALVEEAELRRDNAT